MWVREIRQCTLRQKSGKLARYQKSCRKALSRADSNSSMDGLANGIVLADSSHEKASAWSECYGMRDLAKIVGNRQAKTTLTMEV